MFLRMKYAIIPVWLKNNPHKTQVHSWTNRSHKISTLPATKLCMKKDIHTGFEVQ